MKFNRNSLSLRISLAVSGSILLFGILTLWATYSFSVNRYSEEKEAEAVTVVSHGEKILAEIFAQSSRLVKTVAGDKMIIDFVSKTSKKDVDNVISQLNNYNPEKRYSAIYVIGMDGIVIASTDDAFMKQDYSFREYFIKAIKGGLYSDVNLGVTSGELGYYFSYPIHNDESVIIGVAVVKMNPDVVTELLKDLVETTMSDLMIVDKYGIVVSSDNNERLYQSVGKLIPNELVLVENEKKYVGIEIMPLQYEGVMKLIRDKTPSIKIVRMFDKEDNDEEVLVVIPVASTGFYMVGEISMGEIIIEASNMARIIGLMVSLAVLAAIALVILLTARLLKPIGNLTLMARDISMGKFDQLNPVIGGGELEILGTSMINMASELGEKYKDLEKLVSDRTSKIETQNEILEKSKMAVMNILDDVANSKADLEKFKLAVEEASDHIVITDKDGVILYANKAVEKITGFGVDEVVGKKAGSKELWGGLMENDFYKKLWQTIKTDKKVFSGEVNNKRKSGEKYVAIASISPIIGQNREVVFFVGIERDITHEKEVDRMKTDFISLASHQLRTPLSAMRWFSEMLLAGDAGKLTKEQTEFVKNIEAANTRMITLVNSLLNISRIESGRIVVDPVPTDLKKLVDEQLLELDKNFKDKKQTVLVSASKELPKINVDPKLIREVYKNLLTNANKYTQESGEIEIFISHNDKEILSQVSDNGLGIPKKDQKRIFERFYRAENVVKTDAEGTGLGLYLAKAIVESSGGKIWFESNEGKGCTVWFTLPLVGMNKKEGEVSINS